MIFIRASLILLLSGASLLAQAGQWCASVSGRVSGHSCYSSESACNDAVATAKREQGSGSAFNYSACTEEGGDTGSSTSSGDPADDLIARGASGLVDGMMSGNVDNFAAGAVGIMGGAFLKGMQGDPAADARRAQEAANRAAQAAAQQREYELQQAREEEARKQRLLGEMMLDSGSQAASARQAQRTDGDLGLMLDDGSANAASPHILDSVKPATESHNELGLMLDDEPVRTNPQTSALTPFSSGGISRDKAGIGGDRKKTIAGTNTHAGDQLKCIEQGKGSGAGFDDSGTGGCKLMDGAHAPVPSAVDMSSQREQTIAKNPRMIEVTQEVDKLQAERNRMDADIERLTKERNAEKDAEKMRAKTAELDKQNKIKQEKMVELSRAIEKKEKVHREIESDVDTQKPVVNVNAK